MLLRINETVKLNNTKIRDGDYLIVRKAFDCKNYIDCYSCSRVINISDCLLCEIFDTSSLYKWLAI